MGIASADDSVSGRLRTDVERLARLEGRRVGSSGHAEAAAYLVERLAVLGLEPYGGEAFALPYPDGDGTFANLFGVVPGRDRALPPVLIGGK